MVIIHKNNIQKITKRTFHPPSEARYGFPLVQQFPNPIFLYLLPVLHAVLNISILQLPRLVDHCYKRHYLVVLVRRPRGRGRSRHASNAMPSTRPLLPITTTLLAVLWIVVVVVIVVAVAIVVVVLVVVIHDQIAGES